MKTVKMVKGDLAFNVTELDTAYLDAAELARVNLCLSLRFSISFWNSVRVHSKRCPDTPLMLSALMETRFSILRDNIRPPFKRIALA